MTLCLPPNLFVPSAESSDLFNLGIATLAALDDGSGPVMPLDPSRGDGGTLNGELGLRLAVGENGVLGVVEEAGGSALEAPVEFVDLEDSARNAGAGG